MIDDIKGKYIVDMIKRIFFIILVVLFSIFVYLSIKTKINTNNYEKYLNKNGFKKDSSGIYTKQIDNDNTITYYTFDKEDAILSKAITKKEIKNTTITTLKYNKNQITIEYNIQGINKSGNYSSGIQKGVYNTKTKKYNCKIVLNNDFEIKCNKLKKEAIDFENEVNKMFSANNINSKYVK